MKKEIALKIEDELRAKHAEKFKDPETFQTILDKFENDNGHKADSVEAASMLAVCLFGESLDFCTEYINRILSEAGIIED